jgi:phosphoadenosine phosphosulfate reductase
VNTEEINDRLTAAEPIQRIEWAYEQYKEKLVLSTSFGVQSAVMLHMATQVAPEIPVIFVDTGYLFSETYTFAEDLTKRLNLNLKVYNPLMTAARQEAVYGKRWTLGLKELEQYNLMNKVEPMNRAINELGAVAWLAGLRRNQSSTRQGRQFIEKQNRTVKIYPILEWTDRDIYQYLTKHDLPYHPLWDEGYVSVGDWHSTSKLTDGMNPEDTRFNGMKRECGLHEISNNVDFQI